MIGMQSFQGRNVKSAIKILFGHTVAKSDNISALHIRAFNTATSLDSLFNFADIHSFLAISPPPQQVYIVSGRNREFLEQCMQDLPVGLSAEHGLFFRRYKSQQWEDVLAGMEFSWKDIILPILEDYTEVLFSMFKCNFN